MSQRQLVTVTCPYCGIEQKCSVERGWQVIHCDIDDVPGCETAFALHVSVREVVDLTIGTIQTATTATIER